MSILIAIILGIAVGGVASYLGRHSVDHILINILFSVAGAIAGVVLYWATGIENASTLISPISIIFSLLGALVFFLLFNALHHATPSLSEDAELSKGGDLDPQQKK